VTTVNTGHPGQQPAITVTRGRATRAEIAALVAVLLSVRVPVAAATAAESARPSRWAEGSRTRTALPRPGPHSWRASALPR
jgi:hypothetical protein